MVLPNSKLTKWGVEEIVFTQSAGDKSKNKLICQINGLKKDRFYTVLVDGKTYKRLKTNIKGTLVFDCTTGGKPDEIMVLDK